MKNTIFCIGLAFFTLSSCANKEKDPLPAVIWSYNCVELAPFEGAYRLTGICCEYALLPSLSLDENKSFKVKGSYHSFTGAGFSNVPIEIIGDLSSDNSTLTLKYSVNSQESVFELKPGKAKMLCQCGCD